MTELETTADASWVTERRRARARIGDPTVTLTRGTRPSSPFSSVALGHTDLEIDRYRGRRFICAHPFASNMARVSAMAPDNSACSCARYSRATRHPRQRDPGKQHRLSSHRNLAGEGPRLSATRGATVINCGPPLLQIHYTVEVDHII